MKISIIGAGNMGGAIARGLSKGSFFAANDIFVSDVNEDNLKRIKDFNAEIHCSTSNCEMVEGADIIVLAVKPWLVENIASEIGDKMDYDNQIILSIAAGVRPRQWQGLSGSHGGAQWCIGQHRAAQ